MYSKKVSGLLAALVLTATCGTAFANGNNGNGNGGCGVGQTTNGCGGAGGAGGQGGNGGNGGAGGAGGVGHGGAGGTGVGIGIGKGGNATGGNATGGNATGGSATSNSANLNNNSNRNENRNTNTQGQGQAQGQAQGQMQQSNSSVKNSGNSASVSGSYSGGNKQTNEGNNSSNAASGNSTSVAVAGDVYEAARIPVATAYAPAIPPTAVCALSMSGGAQGSAFGFSIGGSYIDKNCEHLEQVRAANAIGQKEVAAEMMMDVPAFAAAAKRIADRKAGKVAVAPTALTGSAQDQAAYAANQRGESLDPIVRKNMGLPPLK